MSCKFFRPRLPPRHPDDVRSIVPDGSGGVWAAYDQPGGPATLVHVNGRGWRQVRLPGVKGKQADAGLLLRAPRSSALFAFGGLDWSSIPPLSYGVILRYAWRR